MIMYYYYLFHKALVWYVLFVNDGINFGVHGIYNFTSHLNVLDEPNPIHMLNIKSTKLFNSEGFYEYVFNVDSIKENYTFSITR